MVRGAQGGDEETRMVCETSPFIAEQNPRMNNTESVRWYVPEFRPAITEVQRLMLQAMKEERIEVR